MKRRQARGPRFERLEGRALLTGVSGDFNGDGFDDLAVGSPGDSVGGDATSGSVTVIYGSPQGLASTNNRRFTLDSEGIAGDSEANSQFGAALTTGDFNGDGYDDLAIGAPGEVVDGIAAGAVHILLGSRFGLRGSDSQRFHQNTSGVDGVAATGDKFGSALAAGDFNNDGRDDLAIGVPGEDVAGFNDAGGVNILHGRKSSGLTAFEDQLFTQDTAGVNGKAALDDQFGFALAVGNFNGDSSDDLAIGIIGEKVGAKEDAGAVSILYGKNGAGLSGSGDQYRHTDQTNVLGDAVADGEFGFALAAGDFNDDSRDDIAIGAPGEAVTGAATLSGAVHIFYGGSGGTKITGNQKWDKGVAGIAEVPAAGDKFGSSLTVGLINRNRFDDLIIGIPSNTISGANSAGSIRVIFGSGDGLSASNSTTGSTQAINQSSSTGIGTPEANDLFGSSLAIGDYNGDELADVAVGAPGDQTDDNIVSGGVSVFYGTPTVLTTNSPQRWLPGIGGLLGSPETGDKFGGAVA